MLVPLRAAAPSATGVTVLLIEDSAVDSALVDRMVASISGLEVRLEVQNTLAGGLARLAQDGVDLILLDLSLPDSRGLATFVQLQAVAPGLPVIVMSADEGEALALESVRLGAQDYLTKGHVTTASLGRAVRYALERHRLVASLRGLSLVDDLTGLYNRRGFMTLAEAHLRVAMRAGRRFLLVYADLDGLKQINDTLGHRYGDEALVKMADVLRATFRQSDILARLGGDEFVVLAAEAGNDTEHTLLTRLETQLNILNAGSSLPFRVSCSAGVAAFDTTSTSTLEEMLARADRLLYERKRERKRAS
jgi:diguanylate cyclase (GGDEF)-like protein